MFASAYIRPAPRAVRAVFASSPRRRQTLVEYVRASRAKGVCSEPFLSRCGLLLQKREKVAGVSSFEATIDVLALCFLPLLSALISEGERNKTCGLTYKIHLKISHSLTR